MFIDKHPYFHNNPVDSDNKLIAAIGNYKIDDAISIICEGYNVNDSWLGIYPLDLAIAIGDINLVTLILTNGGKVTQLTLVVILRTHYCPTGSYEAPNERSSYSNSIKKTLQHLLKTFSDSTDDFIFELGTNSSFYNGYISEDTSDSNKRSSYSFDDYAINFTKGYCCNR